VLHFVSRYPGQTVAGLLTILAITKQSLGRVLRDLVTEGFVEQRAGDLDRRQRLLFTTARGEALAGEMRALQGRRITQALMRIDPAGGLRWRRFSWALSMATRVRPSRPVQGRSGRGE
jgi:DNA-binding MarR family transcriptional regulator